MSDTTGSNLGRIHRCRSISRIRSPPAKSSSGRRRSSRSWSRTRSTPARRANRDHHRAGRQEADSRRGRRRGDGRRTTRGWPSSGTPPARSRSPRTSARSGRSAFAARRCRALPRCRTSCCARGRGAARPAPRCGSTAAPSRRCARSARPKARAIEVARSLLQSAGAAEIPEVGHRRSDADVASRHADGAGLSGSRVHAHERAGRQGLLECPPAAALRGAVLPAVRRAPRSHRSAQGGRRHADHGYVAALGDQGPVRGAAERLRQSPHRQGPHDRARDHRGLQRRDDQGAQPGGPPVHRRSRRTVSTSTCTRRKRKCASSSSRWCTKCCAAPWATRSGRGRAPELQFTPVQRRAPVEPRPMSIPGVLAGASVGNRWTPEPLGPWRNLMEPGTSPNSVEPGTPQNLVEPCIFSPFVVARMRVKSRSSSSMPRSNKARPPVRCGRTPARSIGVGLRQQVRPSRLDRA